MRTIRYFAMTLLMGAAGLGTAQAQSPSVQGKPSKANEALTNVKQAQPTAAPTFAPLAENAGQAVVLDAASLPKCKIDYMKAHPEEFTFLSEGKILMKPTGSSVATDAPAPNAAPTVYELAALPKTKVDYMRAHPEEYRFRNDGKVETIVAQPTAPTYTLKVNGNAAPVVFEVASLPASKLDYMRSHPDEFQFRTDGKVEMKTTNVPDPGSAKIDVDTKLLNAVSPEKQAYILAHPEQYNLVRGSTEK